MVSATSVTVGGASTTAIALGTNTTAPLTTTIGGAITGNILKIAGTPTGTINLTTDVTTGIVNAWTGVTSGTINVGSASSLVAISGNATINNNLNVGGTFSLNSVPVYQEQIVAITGASTTIDVDFNLAANKYNTFYITLYNANSATINFKNLNTVSSTNKMFSFNIILKNSATALANTSSITWNYAAATTMLSTVSWAGGSTARPPSTVTANAVDIWSFFTFDGGATLIGSLAMKDVKSA